MDECSIMLGVFKMAHALGDDQALSAAGRRVIRLHLGADMQGSLGNFMN